MSSFLLQFHNSPYAFSENRVIDAIELEGLEMYTIHGTTQYGPAIQFNSDLTKKLKRIFNQTESNDFQWSGHDSDKARKEAGYKLAYKIMEENDVNSAITLAGHSHGGNVAIVAAKVLLSHGWDPKNISILAINTPGSEANAFRLTGSKHSKIDLFNVNADSDWVQWAGEVPLPGKTRGDFISAKPGPIDADYTIEYYDQIFHTLEGMGNHLGIHPDNYKEWLPKLEEVVKFNNNVKNRSYVNNPPPINKPAPTKIQSDATKVKTNHIQTNGGAVSKIFGKSHWKTVNVLRDENGKIIAKTERKINRNGKTVKTRITGKF